jgi:hypothetical protein
MDMQKRKRKRSDRVPVQVSREAHERLKQRAASERRTKPVARRK